jgi:hypothetical protein
MYFAAKNKKSPPAYRQARLLAGKLQTAAPLQARSFVRSYFLYGVCVGAGVEVVSVG